MFEILQGIVLEDMNLFSTEITLRYVYVRQFKGPSKYDENNVSLESSFQ